MTVAFKSPATLLNELGIEEPSDIDIEAIAQYCGATVVYEPLHGCAARLVGVGNRGIITVDEKANRARQRFSAGHELGHWMRDRGKIAFSCTSNQFVREWNKDNPERRANRYGAELLLPSAIFKNYASGLPGTFESIKSLAHTFQTSLTATAIRFVRIGDLPTMLICTESNGRKWFFRSSLIPETVWPTRVPGSGSVASELLSGAVSTSPGPVKVDADEWIDHRDASQYCVIEDSSIDNRGFVLTLLWWEDETQIISFDREEEDVPDIPTF